MESVCVEMSQMKINQIYININGSMSWRMIDSSYCSHCCFTITHYKNIYYVCVCLFMITFYYAFLCLQLFLTFIWFWRNQIYVEGWWCSSSWLQCRSNNIVINQKPRFMIIFSYYKLRSPNLFNLKMVIDWFLLQASQQGRGYRLHVPLKSPSCYH